MVNYNPDGSGTGRTEFIQNLDDFTGSDPPFRNGGDELAGTAAEHSPWNYSYIPDVAGGTAFMYHISVGGHLIRNMRLSGLTLMKIFTGKITNWDDPAITHDYGKRLPSLPIVPVIRSDFSGASYFLTQWFRHLSQSGWNAFCQKVHPGIKLPCPETELYPSFGNAKAENGSNNAAAYVTSSFANGSIDYDEYAYALNSHFPVVQVLNPAGYFVGPTYTNVAIALTHAKINEDQNSVNFLQQDLSNVYTNTDPRTYPLSEYSYFIVPRTPKPPPVFASPSGKGQSLSSFINYLLCDGQQHVNQIGYSPLPVNLVRGGFRQDSFIPNHGSIPSLSTLPKCHNPTFINGVNTVTKFAPFPTKCQKFGAPLNCVIRNGKAVARGSGGTNGGSGAGSGNGNGKGSGNGNGSGKGSGKGSSQGSSQSGLPGTAVNAATTGQGVSLAADHGNQVLLWVLTALGILAAVGTPPTLAAWRRRRQAHG